MKKWLRIFPNIINKIYNICFLKYYSVKYSGDLIIKGRLLIQGHGAIKIGEKVKINSDYRINPIGGYRTVFQTLSNGKIIIGNNVGISHSVISSSEKIEIQDDVLIGSGVKIFDSDFHSIHYEKRVNGTDNSVAKRAILIKKGAFIGAHSLILKGVTIGEKAVIGASSVVTKNVPENEVWAGNPAKHIKKIGEIES